MMIRKLAGVAAAILLSIGAAEAANETAHTAATNTSSFVNPFDPNTWMTSFANLELPPISDEVTFNAAHPGAWMSLIDPASHLQMHRMFANPASYTQFMEPQFYMEFTKPENVMAWMNPSSYQVMMQQQTMNYWMNPGSYSHMVDPAMYQQTMNPANYMVYMNPKTYIALLTAQTCDTSSQGASRGWFGYGC